MKEHFMWKKSYCVAFNKMKYVFVKRNYLKFFKTLSAVLSILSPKFKKIN